MAGRFKTLLVLGRVSNLPTVWSDCLAGWWLAGAGHPAALLLLFAGTSLLYVGGMYLNDVFDVGFDRQRRPERPIPAGKISLDSVLKLAITWLALGVGLLFLVNFKVGFLALVLTGFILLYDASHKFLTASPWLMGACRFWVYVMAGASSANGLNGWSVYCGAALAFYIVGLSYVARRETSRNLIPYWPLLLLATPILLALAMNTGRFLPPTLAMGAGLLAWAMAWILPFLTRKTSNVGLLVTNLLAGIVIVDGLAIIPSAPLWMAGAILLLFLLTIALQQIVPAT